MSLLKSSNLLRLCLKKNSVALTAVRNHWIDDHKPGPYPVTEEARLKAAQKYNVHPLEYKPFPNDGDGRGDYPDLVAESAESRDPNYPWDFPELTRNFNEPMHLDFDLMRGDRYDVNGYYKLYPSLNIMILQFVGTMAGLYFIFWIFEHCKGFHSVIPKQYPNDGKKHYTFELK